MNELLRQMEKTPYSGQCVAGIFQLWTGCPTSPNGYVGGCPKSINKYSSSTKPAELRKSVPRRVLFPLCLWENYEFGLSPSISTIIWVVRPTRSEDIENTSSGSEIKIIKLKNAIWGRPEVEGKMICEKYSVKIRIIELRDEEIDGLHVTKGKRRIKVSREEAYSNVVGSNSNTISQSYISTPLQDIENPTYKQSGCSRSPSKENHKTSRKRGRSVTDKAPKRVRMDVNFTSNEDSEFPSDLQDEPRQNELDNTGQTKQYIPHHLIGLMYRLDLPVLCSLRKSTYEHKYPSLSLAFEDSEIDMFSNIVLRYEKKSIHIRIENVDEYYIDNDISYAKLFTNERRSSSINNKQNISKGDKVTNASSNSSGKTEQEKNLGSLQQGDSKIKRKTRKSTVNWSEKGKKLLS
ncbi:uncharacterized protein TNIN_400301 [Trichonephila inaurata madagascariensis]|uniref:Uncharacterized protein n=1 Tax=Trichonephila inaurata madagascariensis TaxID=2747483 RepID=A0A8X6WUS6_9ARAC|nr:uncharacterized protein TNIN_400301 [Trichonephila inaurata madagascariensis]